MTFISTFKSCFLLGSLVLIASCSNDEPVVENENVFINEIYAAGNDWIELYNASNTTVDVSGYHIYDDATKKYALPNGTLIAAGGFLVLLCDDTNTGLHTNFKLSSAGETVYLENAAGKLIDKVTFPALGDGQSYGRYPDGSASLKISGNTSEGTSNGEASAPAIVATTRTPMVPGLADAVTVRVELVNTAGISSATLYYRLTSGTFTSVSMVLNAGFYTGTIPAQGVTGKVEYYVEVKNTAGKTTRDPANSAEIYFYLLNTDALPVLFINEFLAFNTSCCPDTDSGINEFDDWIEIYNPGMEAVNVGGMYLSDDPANPFKHRMPTDNPSVTTIPAGGFLLLWADDSKLQGPLHLNFALSNIGESVGLYYIDGREIDAYTFGAQSENISWGRSVNGGSVWKSFTTPTPKASNN